MTRYIEVTRSIAEGWVWKTPFALLGGVSLAPLISDWPLYVVIALAVLADTLTGYRAANKRGDANSKELRQFVPKLIEYAVVMLVFSGLAWAVQDRAPWDSFAAFLRTGVFVGLILTEAKSISENMGGTLLPIIKDVLSRAKQP